MKTQFGAIFEAREPEVSDWAIARSRVNHDWLKNRVTPALYLLQNVVRGDVTSPARASNIVNEVVAEWLSGLDAVQQLVPAFVDISSPAVYFDELEMRELIPDSMEREALMQYVHRAWCESARPELAVRRTSEALQAAALAMQALAAQREHVTETEIGSALAAVRALSAALTAMRAQGV